MLPSISFSLFPMAPLLSVQFSSIFIFVFAVDSLIFTSCSLFFLSCQTCRHSFLGKFVPFSPRRFASQRPWPVSHTFLIQFDSVTQLCPTLCDPHGLQDIRSPCPLPTPNVYSNSCPLSWWCHPTISFSVVLTSSCLQSFPAPGSFQMSQSLASGGQSTGVSASASVLPVCIQDWSPSEWTGWISLQSKGLSRVFSNTTVQKHQFFGAQLSL